MVCQVSLLPSVSILQQLQSEAVVLYLQIKSDVNLK